MRNFSELNEQEVLALAISLEEDDERTYDNYAHYLEASYRQSAAVFSEMSAPTCAASCRGLRSGSGNRWVSRRSATRPS